MAGLTIRYLSATYGQLTLIQDVDVTHVARSGMVDTVTLTGDRRDLAPLLDPTVWLDGVLIEDADTGWTWQGIKSTAAVKSDGAAVTFESLSLWWWLRICYPVPTSAWPAQSGAEHDSPAAAAAETVALGFIDRNSGPGALAARRIYGMTVPATLGRGGTVTVSARSDILGLLVSDIGEAAGLDFDIVPAAPGAVTVAVNAMPDLSTTARYGTALVGGLGVLDDDWQWSARRPERSVALVAGGGDGVARVTRERTDTGLVAIGGRAEIFLDQRQTVVLAELDKAGDDDLLEASSPVQIDATLVEDPSPSLRLGVEVPLGAKVTIEIEGLPPVIDRVREITTTHSGGNPKTVTGKVGPRDGSLTRAQKDLIDTMRRLRRIEVAK